MTHKKTGNEFINIGQVAVTPADLPLSCPLPNIEVWNAHPRVYLPIVQTGKAICPYCSAKYILEEPAVLEEPSESVEGKSKEIQKTEKNKQSTGKTKP